MNEPQPSDGMERGPYYDSDFEESDLELSEESEDERAFVVDADLDDCDAEENTNSEQFKVPVDAFLYDFCHLPDYNARQNVDDEAIREEGHTDNERENEDEEADDHHSEFSVHDPTVHWKKMKPHLGERYGNIDQLRFCLTNYAVANGYPIKITKSSSIRLQAKCGYDNKRKRCPFKIWASWMNNERSFQVKGLTSKHTCVRQYKHATLVNPDWIAKQFLKQLSARPRMKAREMKEEIKKKFFCIVSTGQCYRAKKKAIEILSGKLSEHYARIWEYGGEIIRSNPGSTAKVVVDVKDNDTCVFQSFYVCFKAIKDGWVRGCRRIIGLDGCFLKGQCKGELLTAIGRDGNNQVYPIAWAVIDVENMVNWLWFIKLLVDDLGVEAGEGLTIISDQHKGIVEAVKEVLPAAEHRQCARHVFANYKKEYNGVDYKKLFWDATMSTTESSFVGIMEELKALNGNAYKHLMTRKPESWSRAFFSEGRACEAVENGISESFNSVILEARTKPLLTMLEEIRMYTMERFYRMSTKHLSWTEDVCPAILTKMDKWCKDMRLWTVVPSEAHLFEVRLGFDSFQVDLAEMACTCRLWGISGIPCVHACAAMSHTQQQPEAMISPWFSKGKFAETYTGNIRPLNGSRMWAKSPYSKPLPPPARRMPGRPKTKRRRHVTENDGEYKKLRAVGGTKVCKNCWEQGHNKRTCKNPAKPEPPKEAKKMGRPVTRDPASQKKKSKQPSQKQPSQKNRSKKQTGCSSQTTNAGEGSSKGLEQQMDLEGLQNVNLVQDFKDLPLARSLLDSGYSKDEVLQALEEQDITVEPLLEPVLEEPIDEPIDEPLEETVPETQHEAVVEPEGEAVPETEDEAIRETPPSQRSLRRRRASERIVPETDDEAIVETPPSQRSMRTRRPSQRITNIKLGKKVGGVGSTSQEPVHNYYNHYFNYHINYYNHYCLNYLTLAYNQNPYNRHNKY
ncbi:hypothetical protein LXL04_018557 [Taraxacum kok-saghyz]